MTQVSPITELIHQIDSSSVICGETKLICIDGPAGSGKTTLATSLSKLLDKAHLIHMDEIYDGWEQALTEKTTNNLIKWIISPLISKQPIEFLKFDWNLMKRNQKVRIENPKYLIIEGVGSVIDPVIQYCALKIWVQTKPEVGLLRVLNRDGNQIEAEMRKWQILETKHFLKYQTKEICDVWVDGDSKENIDTSSQFVRTNR